MELLLKVGGSQESRHWRDGQIADIRPDGFHKGDLTRKHHCILTLPGDYWQLRGSTDWKWPGQKFYDNIKKYLVALDSHGKYPWETTTTLDEKRLKRRDWFIDYKLLLDLGLITNNQFDAIYNKEKDPGLIYIERALDQIIRNENQHQRLKSKHSLSKGTVSAGIFSIGSGLDYDTLTAFELDIIDPGTGPLTGDLTGEHNNEESSVSASVTFDVDTATYLLKIAAQSGDEHNGGAYGNGARITCGTYDSIIVLDETNDQDMQDVEVSKLAFNIAGAENRVVRVLDVGTGSNVLINRLLIVGDSNCFNALNRVYGITGTWIIRNSIIYGCSKTGYAGINDKVGHSGCISYVYNNTICKCGCGIQVADDPDPDHTVKNNLCQGNGTDYVNPGSMDTTAKNISEDATSPDAAYQSKNVHTNSVFKDYANDDYRLDSGGDPTNLAIVDDGEDLSGTFTDDIEGQTRFTWYIGASEIVSTGDVTVTPGVINLASACQGETVKCGATLTPNAINLGVIPQPETLKCGTTITPDALNLACSIQEETVKCGVTITPGIQSVLAQIQEGTVKVGVTVSPNVINLMAATQDETVSLPGGITITPDVIVLVPQTQNPIILTEAEMRVLKKILSNILRDILI